MTCFRLYSGETVRHVCQRYNISYFMVYHYLDKGFSVLEAIDIVMNNKKKEYGLNEKRFYNGKPLYETFKTGSKEYRRIMSRIKRGASVEDAVNLPTKKAGRKPKKQ